MVEIKTFAEKILKIYAGQKAVDLIDANITDLDSTTAAGGTVVVGYLLAGIDSNVGAGIGAKGLDKLMSNMGF